MITRMTVKISPNKSGSDLISVNGFVKYVQPIGFINDKSALETSVPARIIYRSPTILIYPPVALDEVGMIWAANRPIPAPINPAAPTHAPNKNEPPTVMLSTPKLIITTAMKSASMTLTKPENYLGDVTARHSLTPHQYPTHSAKFASPTLGFPAQSSSALNYKTGKQNRFLLADTPSTHALNMSRYSFHRPKFRPHQAYPSHLKYSAQLTSLHHWAQE